MTFALDSARLAETLTRSCPNRRGVREPCVDIGGPSSSLEIAFWQTTTYGAAPPRSVAHFVEEAAVAEA